MFRKAGLMLIMVLSLLVVAVGLSRAQEAPPLPGEEVIGGLGAPRGIAFDAEGNLYVADAGSGGEVEMTVQGPEGETVANAGMTGKVIKIAPDGSVTDHIVGIPSYATSSETLGLYRVIPSGESLWLVYTGTATDTFGAFWTDSVVELDAATLATKRIINLNAFETENDPDGRGYDTNVSDIAWGADGVLYITDAGANALLSWTEADGLQLVASWGNDVPTAVEVAENGDIYVGFLGEAIGPGAARIEHWSGGELVETFDGLTGVTDILLAGDTLYAVQLFLFGDEGPGPGNVVMVTADGVTPVAEGLVAPFGIAMSPDGALYVSYGTIPLVPGVTGGVVKIAQ